MMIGKYVLSVALISWRVKMKQLRIAYTKLIMLDIEDDATKEDIHEIIDAIASEEVFIDGEYDDVEWEVT